MKKFFLTLLLLLFAFCNPGRIEKSQSIELSGEDWYINFNDNPLFSSSDFSHQGWETARVPGNLRLAGKSHRGTFWIRRTVELDPESFTSSMALQFGKVFEKDEVFFNGNLIGINGKKPGDAKQNDFAFGRPRVYPIPHDLLRKGANTIAVRINSEFRNIAGVTTGPVGIVSVKDANEHILNEAIDDIEFIAFYFFVGIFFLINFFKMKEMKEYFSFSIFTIVFAFYLLFKNEFRFEILNTFLVFKYLEYLLLFTLPYLYLLFFQDFFTLEKIRYQNFYLLANLFFALLFVVFRNPIFWNNFISIWSIHILLILGYSAMITYRKILEKNKEGFLYAGALLYFSYAIIKEILIERGIIDGSSALERAYLVFMFFMTAALRFRFILLKLKIQNRFEQLKEVDSLRENIFNHMDKMMTEWLLHIRQIVAQLRNKDENLKQNDAVKEIKSIQENLQYTMDDILELSRLEVMTEAQYKEKVNFVDFIRAVLPAEGKITYAIKVDYGYEIHNSLELINSIIIRLIDFPGFNDFHNIDLIITSDLKGQMHFRFMVYHNNPKITWKLYEELTNYEKKPNVNSIKWAIIKETLRLLEGHLEMRILNRKYLRIDFALQAEPFSLNLDIQPVKESRFKLPDFFRRKSKAA